MRLILVSPLSSSRSFDLVSNDIPLPPPVLVEYLRKGCSSLISFLEAQLFLQHIEALRHIAFSSPSFIGGILWDDTVLSSYCNKRCLADIVTFPFLILEHDGPLRESGNLCQLDTIVVQPIKTDICSIRAYWISRATAEKLLFIFDRPFLSIAPTSTWSFPERILSLRSLRSLLSLQSQGSEPVYAITPFLFGRRREKISHRRIPLS